ncbi:hypothetical protein KQH60_05425 [Mycetohabitans sp. B8]|nr:hypothetical protein [Mycetohabitans sp. B8]MCG1042040.1 hypothetical protein [Mycetohabitans sp. B8]
MLEQLQRAHWVSATSFPEVDPKLNTVSPSPTTGGMSANGWKLPEDAFARRPDWTHIVQALLVLA